MSTFGEIVEPTSRSAWEDWDEIENNLEQGIPKLNWKKNIVAPNEIETLYLLEGKYLSDCVNLQKQYKLDLVDYNSDTNLKLYRTGNKYVCTIKDYNLILSGEIVELLKPFLKVSNEVIAIQTKPVADYQTTLPIQDCIVRTISTSKSQGKNIDYPKLEQPNIVSGISAGVISLREHLDLSGTAIICYLEQLEEYGVKEIQKLLEKLHILNDIVPRPASILDSNLYI